MFQDACEQRPSRRPSSASSAASISSWSSQDEGPSSTSTSRRSSVRFFTYSRREQCVNTPSSLSRTCEGMSIEKTRELWRCMLELQQQYGCYNSTRMDLAVNAGEAGIDLMPNPFIIDTLNHSLVDLPVEGWDMLDRCLRHDKSSGLKKKFGRKLWARSTSGH